MNTLPNPSRTLVALGVIAFSALLALPPSANAADAKRKNPASKLYVASLTGESHINRGEKIEPMTTKAAYNAEGSIIETKANSTNALVYSNGSGIYLEPDSRLEIVRFVQEPFIPNRNDLEVEPSISQTEVILARGSIGLCPSKLVAGSSMKYRTGLGSVSLQNGRVVLEANPEETKISLLEGEAMVRGGQLDLGGRLLKAGQQAIIRPGAERDSNVITIGPIPETELAALGDKVYMACAARKTVYFETKQSDDGTEIEAAPVVPENLPPTVTVSPSKLP